MGTCTVSTGVVFKLVSTVSAIRKCHYLSFILDIILGNFSICYLPSKNVKCDNND